MHNIRKGAPPTNIFHGTKVELIPLATGEEYDRRMQAAGSPSELHLYKDATHGFFNQGRPGDHYADTVAKMDAFLVKHGWLQKK